MSDWYLEGIEQVELHATVLRALEDEGVTDLTDVLSVVGHVIPSVTYPQIVSVVSSLIASGRVIPVEVAATKRIRDGKETGESS